MRPGNSGILTLCLLALALFSTELRADWHRGERELMGTKVTVELWLGDADRAKTLIDEALAEVHRLDQMMNPWNPASELSRVNLNASSAPVRTTPEIIEVLERALHYSQLSDGAFDVSFASVGQHYNYREGKKPNAENLQRDLKNVDFRAIQLSRDKLEVFFARQGLQIDLGGIAKGYAVDRAIGLLQRAGVAAAAVSAGGDSRILGGNQDKPRTVGIRHPRKENQFAALIPLENTAISTSGDYERFFIEDGIRHHHIIDPSTGRSADEVQSVSILAPLAIDSDALSTTTFVLGIKRGLALINRLDGIDAILIDGQGKLHYSTDLLRSAQ